MSATSDVAVIGAGFSGACLTIQLLQRMPAGSRILVIGTPGETGAGLAYGTGEADLLNVRAERMSIHADDEAHFVRWLAEKCRGGPMLSRKSLGQFYVSRASYGRYIRKSLRETVEQARHRVTVQFISGTAVSLRPSGDEFRVGLASGERFLVTAAALCLGNLPSQFPISPDAIAPSALARMIADPWTDARMREIAPDDRVLFIGTGLTMVDQALALARGGHRGRLTALSRHGLLPAIQPESAVVPIGIELPGGNPRPSVLFRTVVQTARHAIESGKDWRGVVDGLRPATQELWQRLSPAGKRRFLRHVEAYWSAHRHRMAPAAGERIEAMQESGTLNIRAGRILEVRGGDGPVEVALRHRGDRHVEAQSFDWIVNCTGPGRYGALAADPLVARLVDQGLARPDGLRLSLDVSRESALVGRNRKVADNLFAIGPVARGRFFEITAAREIRAQTAGVADRLAALKLAEMFPRGHPRKRSAAGQGAYFI